MSQASSKIDRHTGHPRRGRGRSLLLVALLVVAAVVAGLLVTRSWESLRHGTLDPPDPAVDGLETSLVVRVGELRGAVLEEPYSAEAWGALGGVFDVHGFVEEAIVCYERAEALDPDDFRWPYFLGHCRQIGDQRGALADFLRAADLRPDYAAVHAHIGRGSLLADEIDRAEEHFEMLVDADPKIIRGHLGVAQVAVARDDPETALAALDRALALGPDSAEVFQLLEQVHSTLGNREAAAQYREQSVGRRALEPLPDPARDDLKWEMGVTLPFRRQRAEEYAQAGRPELAIAEWRQAIDVDPESAEAHGQLGLLLAAAGKREEAIGSLERSLEIDRRDHSIRNTLGGLLVEAGRTDEGLELMRQSVRFMPDSADAQFNLAQAQRRAGRHEEAVETFARAIQIDGDHVRARFERGIVLGQLGRFDEAVEAFREVVARAPERSAGYANLARALHGADRYREAIDTLRSGLERVPGDLKLQADLAWRLATCPVPEDMDAPQALAIAASLCRSTGYRDATLLETLSVAYAANERFNEAVDYGQQALTLVSAQLESSPQPALEQRVAQLQSELELFRARKPYRDPG